jgi:hypothetical protein
MTEQTPTEVRWIRNGRSSLITFTPVAGFDLTVERSDSRAEGRGFAVYARSVTEPGELGSISMIGRRKLQRDAKILAANWIAARKAEALAELDAAAAEHELPRYQHFADAVYAGKSYRAALDILHAEALGVDECPLPEVTTDELRIAEQVLGRPVSVEEVAAAKRSFESAAADGLNRVVAMPVADARAVTAALEGSDAVTVLIPALVDASIREIAERNDVSVALVRDLYAEQILADDSPETGETFRLPPV